MNVKTNKTKKQANVENQAVNLLSKEELCKRIEGVEKELKSYTGENWKQTVNLQKMINFPLSRMTCL